MFRPTLLGLLVALFAAPAASAAVGLPEVASRIAGTQVAVTCDAERSYTLPGQIHLNPGYCEVLADYLQADPKPTLCDATKQVKVRYRKTIRWHGKIRRVWRTRTVTRKVPPVPCYTSPGTLSVGSPHVNYGYLVTALQVLAHESIHAQDFYNGLPVSETHAECAGMQALPSVVVSLGGTQAEGEAVRDYYAKYVRPRINSSDPAYTVPC